MTDAIPSRVRGHGEPIAPVLSPSESDWRGVGRFVSGQESCARCGHHWMDHNGGRAEDLCDLIGCKCRGFR